MRTVRSSLDLATAMALAVLGLVVALIPVDAWLKAVVIVPMMLVAPGYATSAIFFPPQTLPASERLVYAVALSAAAVAFTGVLVQLLLPLDRFVWAISLSLVTLGLTWLALRRREREGIEWLPPRLPLRVVLRPAISLSVAAVIAGWAISIASGGAGEERERAHFTQIWALPQASGRVAIGVTNDEGATESYRLRIASGGVTLSERELRLGDGDSWQTSLSIPSISPERPLRVVLLRNGEMYRRVQLNNEATP